MHRLLLATLALTACGSDLSPCEARTIADCDIHAADCQESHNELLRCVRGDDQPSPKFLFLTPDEYQRRYPAGAASLDPLVLRGLALLDLASVPPNPTGPAGTPPSFFDDEQGQVVVIDDDDLQSILHALAEAHADAALGGYASTIAPQRPALSDTLVGLAIFVGESVFYGDAAYFKTAAMDDADFHEHLQKNLYYDDSLLDALAVAREPALEYAAVGGAFAGAYGPRLSLEVWLDGGPEALRDLYPPDAVRPRELIRGQLDDDPVTTLDDTLPVLPLGLEYVAHDSLGPWYMHAFQIRANPPPPGTPLQDDLARAREIADAWADDRVSFIHDLASDQIAVWWQVALVDGAALTLSFPAGQEGAWTTLLRDGQLHVVGADTPQLRDRVLASL